MRIILATLTLILSFTASAFNASSGLTDASHSFLPTTVATQATDNEWDFPDPFDDMEGGDDDSGDSGSDDS